MALITRPSQPGDGRTAAAPSDTMARQPRRTPSSARKRHQQRIAAGKSDHLAGDRARLAGLDHDARADRHGMDRPRHLHHQAAHADDAAVDLDAVEFRDLFGAKPSSSGKPFG